MGYVKARDLFVDIAPVREGVVDCDEHILDIGDIAFPGQRHAIPVLAALIEV